MQLFMSLLSVIGSGIDFVVNGWPSTRGFTLSDRRALQQKRRWFGAVFIRGGAGGRGHSAADLEWSRAGWILGVVAVIAGSHDGRASIREGGEGCSIEYAGRRQRS